jgi:hypothetical protein
MMAMSNLPDTSSTHQMHTGCLCHTASSYSLQEQGYSFVNAQLLFGQQLEQPDEQAIQQTVHCKVQTIVHQTPYTLWYVLKSYATSQHFRLIMKLLQIHQTKEN